MAVCEDVGRSLACLVTPQWLSRGTGSVGSPDREGQWNRASGRTIEVVGGVPRKSLEVRNHLRGPGRPSLWRGSPGGRWRIFGGSAACVDKPRRVIEGTGSLSARRKHNQGRWIEPRWARPRRPRSAGRKTGSQGGYPPVRVALGRKNGVEANPRWPEARKMAWRPKRWPEAEKMAWNRNI